MISRTKPEFWELYRALSAEIRVAAGKAYEKFSQNPAHPSLQLERLRSDPRAWAVRITRDYPAVALRSGDVWVWFWIGTHRDFDRRFPR